LIEDLESFFNDLKECYVKERQEFNWNFEKIGDDESFLHYMAYNLSHNILHGPLPDHLHSRMILESNEWSKKYVQYLEGK